MRRLATLALLAVACHDVVDPEDPFYIRGSVETTDGAPEADAVLTVEWRDPTRPWPGSDEPDARTELRTDSRGAFVLEVQAQHFATRRRLILPPTPDGSRTVLDLHLSGLCDIGLPPVRRGGISLRREGGRRFVVQPSRPHGSDDVAHFLEVEARDGVLWRERVRSDTVELPEGAVESAPGLRAVARQALLGQTEASIPLLNYFARAEYSLEDESSPVALADAFPVPASRGASCDAGTGEDACPLTDGRMVPVVTGGLPGGWSVTLPEPRAIGRIVVRGAVGLQDTELFFEGESPEGGRAELGAIRLRSPVLDILSSHGWFALPGRHLDETFAVLVPQAPATLRSVHVRSLLGDVPTPPMSIREVSLLE